MRILLLNISDGVSTRLAIALRRLDHAVDVVEDPADAQPTVLASTHDLVVMDLDGATAEAVDLVRWIRVTKPSLKILVCKSRDELDIISLALSKGADEFVLKPLDIEELKVRILALEAQGKGNASDDVVVRYGPLRVDLATRQVWLNGNNLDLTPRERSVLQVLLRHRGNVVSKEYIASRIFSMEDEAAASAIEIYIHRLRRKAAHPDLKIKTVRGLGYQLEAVPLAAA